MYLVYVCFDKEVKKVFDFNFELLLENLNKKRQK